MPIGDNKIHTGSLHTRRCVVGAFADDFDFRMRIVINTSSSGAAITQNQYDVPLLVRLNGTTFDFSEAHGGASMQPSISVSAAMT